MSELSQSLTAVLSSMTDVPTSVVPSDLQDSSVLLLDLSPGNTELNQVNLTNTEAFNQYLFAKLARSGAKLAVGGYNEERAIYRRSNHFSGEEPRTIHLGVDLWTFAGTPVYAPLAGRVHSFKDNAGFGDYGPTIVLQHMVAGISFYTLYGHLSRNSLNHLVEGKRVAKGEQIGEIGPYPENGDWPPHLHFQLMTDMQGLKGDFPGVAAKSQREHFLQLCPDPNLLLRISVLKSTE
jgi:murein DD-endopeptidase MepM/ murein hydrolase activator NlpD